MFRWIHKTGIQSTIRANHFEKQSKKGTKGAKKREDKEISSGWDLVVGFHRWGWYGMSRSSQLEVYVES